MVDGVKLKGEFKCAYFDKQVGYKQVYCRYGFINYNLPVDQVNMQIQQFIPYFRQSINKFIRLSSDNNSQQDIEEVSKNVISLTKHGQFLEVAFYVLVEHAHENNNFENILISNLIKDKFKYEFETISAQNINLYYNELVKMFLLQKTKSIRIQSSSAFFSNIELSLAYIFINIISQKQESIQNFLLPLIPENETLANSYQANHYLKVLGYISSEIDDNKIVIDEISRENAKKRLIEYQIQMLVKLNDQSSYLWNNYYVEKDNIIKTFSSWITITYNEMVYTSLPEHYLTSQIFQLLRDDETIQSGVECIKQIIDNSRSYEQNKGLYDLFLDKMRHHLARQTQKLILRKQFTIAEEYIDVMIVISTKLTSKFIEEIREYVLFVKTIAELSLYRSIDFSNSILNFWDAFFNQVYKYLQTNNSQFTELFRLLASFCFERTLLKCQFTKTEIQKLQIQDESVLKKLKEIYNIRNKSEDLLITLSKVIGINEYTEFVTIKLGEQICKETIEWPKVQVYFFSLLIKPIEHLQVASQDDNDDKIRIILSYYYQLSEKQSIPINFDNRSHYIPIAVKRIFIKFLKSIMRIKHLDKTIIQEAILYSEINFSNSLLSSYAEKTFSKICETKSYAFQDHMENVIELIERYPLKSYIISGVFNLICGQSENIQKYLHTTFKKVYIRVYSDLHSHKNNGQSILCLISCSKAIFEHTIIQDHLRLVKEIYAMIEPLIQDTLVNPQKVQDDEDIGIERISKVLKYFMRCLKENFSQFLSNLLDFIERGFSKYPVCSYLYIFEVVIPIFSNSIQHQHEILQFYKYLCVQTSNYFQEINLQRYILLLQDFLGMNKKLFMCNAALVSKCEMFEELLNLCYYFIFHDNIKISRAAYSYLEAIFMVYWRKEFIQEFNQQSNMKSEQVFILQNQNTAFYCQFKNSLLPEIPNLISKAFHHLSLSPHEATREYILECLYSEIKAFNIQNLQVWAKVLNDLPSEIMLNNEKQAFFTRLSSLNNDNLSQIKDSLEQIKKLLSLISKRYTYAYKRANLKLYP